MSWWLHCRARCSVHCSAPALCRAAQTVPPPAGSRARRPHGCTHIGKRWRTQAGARGRTALPASFPVLRRLKMSPSLSNEVSCERPRLRRHRQPASTEGACWSVRRTVGPSPCPAAHRMRQHRPTRCCHAAPLLLPRCAYTVAILYRTPRRRLQRAATSAGEWSTRTHRTTPGILYSLTPPSSHR